MVSSKKRGRGGPVTPLAWGPVGRFYQTNDGQRKVLLSIDGGYVGRRVSNSGARIEGINNNNKNKK